MIDVDEESFRRFCKMCGLEERPISVEKLGALLKPLLDNYGVRYAILFGSSVRGNEKSKDIDIAVSMEKPDLLNLGKLLVDIADVPSVHEDRVDLVLLENATLYLIHSIIMEGKIIYGDKNLAYSELLRKYLEYLDINQTFKFAESKPTRQRN